MPDNADQAAELRRSPVGAGALGQCYSSCAKSAAPARETSVADVGARQEVRMNTRTYSRRELYEQVWAEPIRKLAPRCGISDVALAKMCRRLGIPLPGVGYWTKVACGHQIARPPLPPPTIEQPEEVVVEQVEPRARSAAAVAEPIPDVRVGDQLRDPHQLVVKTKTLATDCRKDLDGRICVRARGGLDTIVGAGTLSRALRIMDAILKKLERSGHKVGVEKERPFPTYVEIRGQRVAFQLREGAIRTKRLATDRDPYPYLAFDSQPNGVLTLEIKEYLDGERKVWRDGKRHPLEEQLGRFVVGLERAAICLEARHQRFLKAELERQAERIRQAELAECRREEQEKVDELLEQLSSWRKSEALRSFVAATRAAAIDRYGRVEVGSELYSWIKWALSVADRLDPLVELDGGSIE